MPQDESTEEHDENDPEEDWKVQRDHHKALGDQAFRCFGFQTAIDEYSKAISLDPEYLVAYSNRSAAYLKNREKSKALKDAETLVQLDPKFAKGYSRLAAALHALTRYGKAKDAYEKVIELDPENRVAKEGIDACEREMNRLAKQEEERRTMFEQEQEDQCRKDEEQQASKGAENTSGVEKSSAAGNDEDDLLNEFFDDVDEATKAKPVAEEKPAPTNAIKHQREALGTAEDQMDRLLKTNYEWRNLNPFYVLQLPATATEEDISRRYKALSLLLHPDKNVGSERAQLAYDQVQKAKNTLQDSDRARHARQLMEEGSKHGRELWSKMKQEEKKSTTLAEVEEKEILRIFALVEKKRREVEQRERKFEQRERQQEDDALEKERKARQFDKHWRQEERVDKRIGNWREFASNKKKKPKL